MSTTLTSAPPAEARRTLSPPVAYGLAASVIGLALFAASTPTPLYGTYEELWGFSPLVLTLVYAVYAFGVLASLLLAGSVSDHVGRRPVLLFAFAALVLTTGLFIAADSVVWLFAARGLQGIATGLALGAASAALLELHPRRDPTAVGLTNGVVSAGGLGLGVLVSAAIVELLPAPRVLPYVLLLVLDAVVCAAVLRMPEPVSDRSRLRLNPHRPRVPVAVRRPFVLAGLGVISSWSIGGLFFALGPQLSAGIFHTGDHFVTGLAIFVVPGAGSAAQLALGRSKPWAGAAGGGVALAAGTLAMVEAVAIESAALFLTGAVLAGAGFGVAFLGGLRTLVAAIPPEQRAAVMSAFYVVAYLSLSVPAIVAGLVVTPVGLNSTFEIFGSVVAVLALLMAVLAWQTRPLADRTRPRWGLGRG